MTEGKTVAAAYHGPSIEHDELIGFIDDRNREDRQRSSSAGESRQKIGAFLDETAMNGKALGYCRQILKVNDKDDGQHKAMDIIMSLKTALPMIEAHVAGQGTTAMDFDAEPESQPDDDLPREAASDGFTDDAFGRGNAAYEAGITMGGNPFDADMEIAHHQLWNKGWQEAYDEDVANADLDDDTIETLGAEMDADLDRPENVLQPHFGGDAA